MNYDPNLTCSGRMAKQKVKLTFAKWEYSVTMETEVGGNCTGLSVIECAVGRIYEELPLVKYGRHEIPSITLFKENGDTLTCDDDEDKGDDYLKDMLIAAEITGIQPDAEEDGEEGAK